MQLPYFLYKQRFSGMVANFPMPLFMTGQWNSMSLTKIYHKHDKKQRRILSIRARGVRVQEYWGDFLTKAKFFFDLCRYSTQKTMYQFQAALLSLSLGFYALMARSHYRTQTRIPYTAIGDRDPSLDLCNVNFQPTTIVAQSKIRVWQCEWAMGGRVLG